MTKCLIVMPVGPFPLEFIQDTVDSFNAWIPADECEIWVMDDTNELEGLVSPRIPMRVVRAKDLLPEPTPVGAGIWGGITLKLLRTMVMARADFDYDVALRIDTDAVITGPSPHVDIARQFDADPSVAIIGAFTKRGDGSEKSAAMRHAGAQLKAEMSARAMLVDLAKRHFPPTRLRHMRPLGRAAKGNDLYTLGDTCTGGAAFMSRAAIDRFVELGFPDLTGLRYSYSAEDGLFGLFAGAAGMRLSDDLSGMMAVNWQGLPCQPEEVVERGVKVFHPVKLADDPSAQAQIRREFAGQRSQQREEA